jgi:transposase
MWPRQVRDRMLQRLLEPNAPRLIELAEESGIPEGTLSRWRHEARTMPDLLEDPMAGGRRPRDWSAQERLRVVVEAAGLSDEELGEFLRREGLHDETLRRWRADALAGLEGPPSRGSGSRRERALERELRRKDKALAEAAALLILQKKARDLFGDPEDDGSEQK